MKSSIPRVLIAVALATSLVACGSDNETATSEETTSTSSADSPDETIPDVPGGSGNPVRWATTTQPTSFDPATVGASPNIWFVEPIYDTLVESLEDGTLVPGLATEWTLADDAMSLELTLREGVTFQDDTPFDAEAVVASLDHFMADDSLLKPSLAMIESVEAVDPMRVRLNFNRPGGDVPQILSGFAGMMVSPASLEAGTTSTDPVGAGPFTLNTVTDSGATYDYWEGYWAADTIIPSAIEVVLMTDDAARLNALRSGQVDAALIRPAQLAEAEAAGLNTHRVPAPSAYGISVNATHPVLAEADVRKALSMAIDREGIVEGLLDGECSVSAQPYPPNHFAYASDLDEQYVSFDPDSARATVEGAAPDGLSLKILTVTVTQYQQLAEVIQEQLAEVGIQSSIEALDPASYFAAGRAGEYDLMVQLLTSASPDPSTWAEMNYRLAPNAEEFIDPTIPELITTARETVDQTTQGEAIAEITATALAAGTNQIVICLPGSTWATGKNVSGFEATGPRHMLVE